MQDVMELQQIADKQFTDDKFVKVDDVCVFAEHETKDSKGNPQRYDKAALQAIVDRCNHRIADTGDFATLTDGHTPSKTDAAKGAKQPEVLGFMGPFRVGEIGNVEPRAAIFATQYHFRDSHSKVSKLPRRSVELWMDPDMSKRFFDPIAALGAETPRLDLGLKYHQTA